ncbi:TPA: tRNA (adenosine(37)-N6)-threonylcarbamoyltransferase complex dimerization subunit type 1 TsaB [Candidatus Gastranaerophilales bacterium HUM_22]|nr:MAG TPA: tRNA (adenosine(37)-N6)-threonylcarbamoyltransferase complex dimerization subunit type 1 TsaB [Candidatus Gastranaerophilales bacterium HUM_22]
MLLHRKGKKLKILAFDTCLDKTYITLSEDNNIIHSETILSDGKNYHSAYLISTIVKVLKDAGLTPDDIDLITTDIGPGSFTGIRACTTVARVLAQQLNIKAAGVSSLEILSKILGGNDLVALDARKNKAYVYDGKILGAIELETVDELVKGRRVITDDSLKERLSEFASEVVSYQQGEYPIGEILAKLGAEKEETDWRKLKPLYIQPPPVTLKKL